uniref:AB hydrolase-1 domain-containing protein n=1 Tax=Xiphophorus couchianus TaxID=32473 RepID=A0A3B5LNB5_9TELE
MVFGCFLRGFLSSVASQSEGALIQAERGQVTLNQVGLLVNTLLSLLTRSLTKRLRYHGVLTAVLANHWLDDSASGDRPARLLCLLGSNFDLVLQSCRSGHRVPEVAMFNSALDQLGIPSQQALWLDVDQESVKAAEKAGMEAVLVENLEVALRKLAHFTGVQVQLNTCRCGGGGGGDVSPFSHLLPLWQIPALAAAGFRVLALDMKGYGESTAPPGGHTHKYNPETQCDLSFWSSKSIPQVTLVGHDWGGALVWTMARYFPERIRAVASLNTPLFPPDPSKPASEKLKALPAFDYQIYFQKPGVAEAELENDLERTFNIFFSSGREADRTISSDHTLKVNDGFLLGGLFVGLPQQIPRSSMLTEADLRYYVGRFRGSGFRGPLNWYRNNQANWKWMCSQPTGKVAVPALMVTAGKDPVLLPAMSDGMEDLVPNLSRGYIEDSGHWTQMDKPAETNNILISWLRETHGPPAPKL